MPVNSPRRQQFLQSGAVERFTRHFVEHVEAIKVGDGAAPGVQMGPMSNQRRLDAMDGFVADAEARGARILTGGHRIGNRGYFFAPTVFADIPADAEVMTREPFGPLAPIRSFNSLDEVVEAANSLPFGLAAYAFTGSHRTAALMSSGFRGRRRRHQRHYGDGAGSPVRWHRRQRVRRPRVRRRGAARIHPCEDHRRDVQLIIRCQDPQ